MKSSRHSKLKILSIISGDLWAGAENMACNLLKRLKDYDDLELSVVLLNAGRLADELNSIGVTVYVIDERQNSFLDVCRMTRKITEHTSPAIIHSHRYKENILAALTTGLSRNIKLIATQHGLPEPSGNKNSLANAFISKANFHLLSRHFTKTVAVSEDVRNFLVKQHSFQNERVVAIHNGIEIAAPNLPRTKTGLCVIGSSGRLFQVKDYPLMVEIARSIASRHAKNVRFELAGDGPDRTVLESMIQSYGLQDSFIMKGHQDDMKSFYRGIDIYLNTSIHEGIPMTILEALAQGIPVIAPAVGGIREIFTNGVEGFLIENRNPQAFAEKCLLLCENRELRDKMAKAARQRAENAFSSERMAENYHRLYHQAVTKPL